MRNISIDRSLPWSFENVNELDYLLTGRDNGRPTLTELFSTVRGRGWLPTLVRSIIFTASPLGAIQSGGLLSGEGPVRSTVATA